MQEWGCRVNLAIFPLPSTSDKPGVIMECAGGHKIRIFLKSSRQVAPFLIIEDMNNKNLERKTQDGQYPDGRTYKSLGQERIYLTLWQCPTLQSVNIPQILALQELLVSRKSP